MSFNFINISKILNILAVIGLSFDKLNYRMNYINNSNNSNIESITKTLSHLYKNVFEIQLLKNKLNFRIENEIKKSFIKSQLIYSDLSTDIAYDIVNKFMDIKKINPHKVYFTNCYPILHNVEDTTEEGNYHIDQDGLSKIYTLWTPITNYEYSALSYFKYGYLIHKLLEKIFKKNILKFYNKINVIKYNTIVWSGLFIHKGNLNISNNYSSALVVWISLGKKKKSDISYNFSTYKKNKVNSNNYIFPIKSELKKEFDILIQIVTQIINITENKNCKLEDFFLKFEKLVTLDFFTIDNKRKYSFLFSLLAQRLNTISIRKINVELNNIKLLIIFFDLLSVFLGLQSYASFMRLFNNDYFTNINNRSLLNKKLIELKIFKNEFKINQFKKNGFQY